MLHCSRRAWVFDPARVRVRPMVMLVALSYLVAIRLSAQSTGDAHRSGGDGGAACALARDLAPLVDDSLAFVSVPATRSAEALNAMRKCAAKHPRSGAIWFRFGYLAHLHHARAEQTPSLLSRLERIRLRAEGDSAMKLGLEYAPDSARFWYLWTRVLRHRDKPLLFAVAGRWLDRAETLAAASHDSALLSRIHTERAQQLWLEYQALADRAIVQGSDMTPSPEMFLRTGSMSVWAFMAQSVRPLDDRSAQDMLVRLQMEAARATAYDSLNDAAWSLRYRGLLASGSFEELVDAAKAQARVAPGNAQPLLVLGYGVHRTGRAADAESAFDSALALMPLRERARWLSTASVVDVKSERNMTALSPAATASMSEEMYERIRPFALLTGNESRSEILARKVEAALRFSQPELGVSGLDTDRGVILVRYGPPDHVASFSAATGGRTMSCGGVKGEDPQPIECLSTSDVSSVVTLWGYESLRQGFVFIGAPTFGTARFAGSFRQFAEYVRQVRPMDATALGLVDRVKDADAVVARFRGDASGRVGAVAHLSAARFPVSHVARASPLARANVIVGSLVGTSAAGRRLATDSSTVSIDLSNAESVERVWIQSVVAEESARWIRLELVDPLTRAGSRAMLDLPAFRTSGRGVSELVVARGVSSGAGSRWFDVNPQPAVGPVRRDSVVLLWEGYDLSERSTWEYDVTVEVRRVQQGGTLRSVGAALGSLIGLIGGTRVQATPDRVRIDYRRAFSRPPAGTALEVVTLGIGALETGDYVISVQMRDPGGAWQEQLERSLRVER